MTRSLLLGLVWLALLVIPFQEAAAQGASGEQVPRQAEAAVVEAPDPDPGAVAESVVPPDQPPPTEEPTTATAAEPARALPAHVSKMLMQDDLAPGAEIVMEGQPLAIEEAIALSIRNGLEVEVERFGPLIAEADALGAWGAYDPTLSANAQYDVAKSPNFSAFNPTNLRDPSSETNRDRVLGGGAGVSQLIPYIGASVDARFNSASTATRQIIQPLDQQYDSSFFLSARVPLARNLIWSAPWTNVKLAGYQSDAAQQQFRQALMDTVQTTVNRYWGLVAARDRVRVAQTSLEAARALLDQTKTQYEVGVVSQVEVVEAEAGVAQREVELIQTANTFRNSQDALIDAVLGPELSALTDLQFVPTADLGSYQLEPIDIEQSVAKAFENRPELQIAANQIEQGEVDLRFAKNQRLPQVDVEGAYGYVGISGQGNDNLVAFGAAPPNIPEDMNYGESTDGWFTRDGANNYRVQGIFSIPIPNTSARKRVDRSQFELRRSKASRVRLEQGIILEIRSASRTLFASAGGIEAAERRRLAAQEQLRAERIRLEHGESTPFDVLLRQEDLVEAESQKISALQLFRAAETALDRAEGTILDSHAIELDAARVPVR